MTRISEDGWQEAMRLPRLTTRRLMAAVAVVGVLLAVAVEGTRLVRRRDECLRQASLHALFERACRYHLERPVIDTNRNSRLSPEQEAKFALDRLLKKRVAGR